ncbi:MAG TPA: Gfo/Idh/MocA family oxidoreductase [Devosia sp.]|nr:Gfo/Idh/MocA family oxidoreductase [Devosia sp.]
MRIGLAGIDSSHAEDFLRHFNVEERHHDIRVTTVWGPDMPPVRVAELATLSADVRTAATLDELIADVDAVIVGDRHGDLHLRHALAGLAAGRPVFIDKPLACTPADAEAIVDAAEAAGTPLLSGSALRWQDETVALRARLAYCEEPAAVQVYGTWYPDSPYGGAIFYAIHTIELMQELVGVEWRDMRIEVRGAHPVVRCRCGEIDAALAFHPLGESGSSDFGVRIASPRLTMERRIHLGDDYMLPVVNRIVRMLQSGKGDMTRDQLLAPVRMMAEIGALLRT